MSQSLSELVEEMFDKENLHSNEGSAGVHNLTKLVGKLGYSDLTEFLEDNSGAIEALVTWIGDTDLPEWKDKLVQYSDHREVVISNRSTETGNWYFWECEDEMSEDFPTEEEARQDAQRKGYKVVAE